MTVLARLLVILPLVVTIASAQQKFIEPAEESLGVEYYDLNDQRFGIYRTPVSWDEANKLCPTALGSLVEFVSPEVAEFIARALAESAVGFGALWIGGRYAKATQETPEGKWTWVNSSTPIGPPDVNLKSFPMETSPFWVDKPDMAAQTDLCLGTDRRLHHLPLIVPLDCSMKRPFICKVPLTKGTGVGTEIKPPVEVQGRKFFLFRAQATWDEAHKACKDMGMALAKLTTAEQFRIIGHKMLRARPIIENAWIGGIYQNGQWTWMSTDGGPINMDKAQNTSDLMYAWYRPDNIMDDGCLLADRHLCGHFVYVEAKCDRRRSYICELETKKLEQPVLIKVPGTEWYISSYTATWNNSQADCQKCIKGGEGQLLRIDSTATFPKVLVELYKAMALTLNAEIRHVWLGAHLFDKTFTWTKDGTAKPANGEEIKPAEFESKQAGGENGLLTYCEVDFDVDKFLTDFRCLNLDRENQKNFFMYGLTCDLKQNFICSGPKSDAKVELEDICKGMGRHGSSSGVIGNDDHKRKLDITPDPNNPSSGAPEPSGGASEQPPADQSEPPVDLPTEGQGEGSPPIEGVGATSDATPGDEQPPPSEEPSPSPEDT